MRKCCIASASSRDLTARVMFALILLRSRLARTGISTRSADAGLDGKMLWCGWQASTWTEGHPWRLAASGEAQALGNITLGFELSLILRNASFTSDRQLWLWRFAARLGGLLDTLHAPVSLVHHVVVSPHPSLASFLAHGQSTLSIKPAFLLPAAIVSALCLCDTQYHRFTLSAGILSTTNHK